MVVTFNCAAHTWLLFMISFGLSCVGLIWGTNTENNSKRDTCSTVWGEKMLSSCHSGGFFEAEGISARDLDLGRKGLLSLPRLMGLQLYAFWSRWTAVLHFPDLLVVLKTANSTTVKGLWFLACYHVAETSSVHGLLEALVLEDFLIHKDGKLLMPWLYCLP